MNASVLAELLRLDCAPLSLQVDPIAVLRELAELHVGWQCYADAGHEHIQRNPGWFAVSLTSSTGRSIDDWSARSTAIEHCNRLTEIGARLRSLHGLLDRFAPVTRSRLYRLAQGEYIEPHTDDNLSEYGLARLLLPLRTAGCVSTVGTTSLEMVPRKVWFLNDSRMHAVDNRLGGCDRLAVVIQTYNLDAVFELLEA